MRKLLIAILFLLALSPALALGQAEKAAFTVKKVAPAVEQPVGTIDRVSKRSDHSRTFEQDSLGSKKMQTVISAERLNYQDSTGAWKKIDLSEQPAKTAGYAKRVDVGQSIFEYDSTGRVRYQKGKGWLELVPAFKDVGIEFNFNANGLKANYLLGAKSPSRLAWGLKESESGLAQRKIEPFTAVDDSGKAVPVAAEITKDSLILLVDNRLAQGEITVDPSISDTSMLGADTTAVAAYDADNALADWKIARNMATANNFGGMNYIAAGNDGGNTYVSRMFLKFPIPALGNGPDSARIYVTPGNLAEPPDSIYIILGNWTGLTGKATFNDFVGWPDSTEYDGAIQIAPYVNFTTDSTLKSSLFNAAGVNALDSLQSDTMRVLILHAADYLNDTTSMKVANGNRVSINYKVPNIVIYYTAGNPPGLGVVATDTLRYVQHILYSTIDSTGGYNLTVRGFQSFLKGDNTDTSAATDTGDYGAGAFSRLSPPWLPDTSYVVRAMGINPSYTVFGAWDTLSTAITGGGAATVDIEVMGVRGVRTVGP